MHGYRNIEQIDSLRHFHIFAHVDIKDFNR